MSLIINGTTIPTNGDYVKVNGILIDEIIANATSVWKKAKNYYVKFNANGGGGTMANQTFTIGVAQALTANVFTYPGYTYLGWNTSSQAAAAAYTDKQTVTNLTTAADSSVNLYAIWKTNARYAYTNGAAASPATTPYVSYTASTGHSWGFGINGGYYDISMHTNSNAGNFELYTRNIDGTYWIPTNGCKYVNITARRASGNGSNKDGVVGQTNVMAKTSSGTTVNLAVGLNMTLDSIINITYNVSAYTHVQVKLTCSYSKTTSDWINVGLGNMYFYN